MITHFILYVRDQQMSTEFYTGVLKQSPSLNVPGMTEFHLSDGCILGLMPEAGIKKLLGPKLPDPASASGIPRAEIYLVVENATEFLSRAVSLGAQALSEVASRDWGHAVGYCMDKDGHVLAFAQAQNNDSLQS